MIPLFQKPLHQNLWGQYAHFERNFSDSQNKVTDISVISWQNDG